MLVITSLLWLLLGRWVKLIFVRAVRYGLIFIGVASLSLSSYLLYFYLDGRPADAVISLQPGLNYHRNWSPVGTLIHRVEIDLQYFSFAISRPTETSAGYQYRARTTSSALVEYSADLAVNASFFYPFKDRFLLDYFPHSGDMVKAVGATVIDGKLLTKAKKGWPLVVIDNGSIDIASRVPAGEIDYAVSAKSWLVKNGKSNVNIDSYAYPRTAIGFNQSRSVLYVVVADGKQPRYRNGITLADLADYLVQHGVHEAVELDGGGSSTLVWRDADGAKVLNRPIHTKIPGRQRPVANHLLVFKKY